METLALNLPEKKEQRELPTADEWNQLKAMMQLPFGTMKFLIDGYNVTFQRTMASANKLTTMTYVNGEFRGGWSTCDNDQPKHEEAKRFLQLRSKAYHSVKEQKRMKRTLGAKYARSIGVDKKHYWCDPCWNSFNSLKAHLLKHNKNITMVKDT